MKQYFRGMIIILSFLYFFSGIGDVHGLGEGDRINMAVSPIRDEFVVSTGTTTTRQITFYNNADIPYNIYITTEDCQPGTNYGTPLCQSAGTSGLDITKSSTWITPSETGIFTVGPRATKVVTYTVNTPLNAPPGGHYGAIFFNNPNIAVTGNAVNMNRRIGMLYLMTVPGQIIVNTTLGDILVDPGPGGGASALGPSSLMTLFSAPSEFFDVTVKRFMMYFTDPEKSEELMNDINPLWEKPTLSDQDFLVSLKVPVQNAGNTHVRPTGKIYLYDGDTRLEHIGKQSIVDENGVYLGEKIVDFLPINDEGGNVLPNTDRTFSVDWEGFAYNDIDPVSGRRIVGFESPSSYFSRISGNDSQIIFPWEKLAIQGISKTLKADVEVSYKNPVTGLNEVYTLELPVPIHYTYIAKSLNWSGLILILLIVLLIWMVTRRNKKIHVLEDETHHLEDEIHVLERARAALKIDKKTALKKDTSKAKTVKKAPAKAPAKSVVKKAEVAAEKKPAKKITAKAPIPPAGGETKTPAKKPTVKKAPAKKVPPAIPEEIK